jgi:hypothetical protein
VAALRPELHYRALVQTEAPRQTKGDAPAPQVSVAVTCGKDAPQEAVAALEGLDGGLDPLVREHALAIVSALLSETRRAPHRDGAVGVEAWIRDDGLRVELDIGCLDLSPESVARGCDGVPASAVGQIARLADRWGISNDGQLRLWFEIDRSTRSGAASEPDRRIRAL